MHAAASPKHVFTGLQQEERHADERRAHAEQLRAQIAIREELARRAKASKAAEGALIRQQLAEHKALIEVGVLLAWVCSC